MANYDSQILDAIEASNRAFEQFKSRIDKRLDQLETTEAKSRRPHLGGDFESKSGGPFDSRALTGERKDFSDFLRSGERKAMSVGSGPDGGYAVPKVIDGAIETMLLKTSPIRQLASIVQISTSDFHKLVNTRGEAASWVGETEARPATATPQLADIAPPMGELYANAFATQQMLDDVFFNAEQWLAEVLSDKFAEAENQAFVTGTAVNQPKGFLTYPVAATGDATRAFGTLEYIASGASGAFASSDPTDVLVNTVQKMLPAYRQPGEASWLMSPGTLAALMKLKDTLGRPLVMPSYMSGSSPMLLGYPVHEASHMPDLAANSLSIAFGNWKRAYLIVDRIGTRVLRDPFSAKPLVGFFATKRTGASIVNSAALKLIKFAAS